MELKSLVAKLLNEGKNDSEIALAVMEAPDAKLFDASTVAELIASQKKTNDVLAALKKIDDEKKAAEAISLESKKIDDLVSSRLDEKLKSVQIDFGRFKTQKELNRFNPKSGKIESVQVSEIYSDFNSMLKSFTQKDWKEAKSISNRIDIANDIRDAEIQGLQKATPTVSDVSARGGFSIPTEVSDMIMQMVYSASVMYARANKDSVIYQSKVYPVMYGIEVGYVADQTTALTERNPTFANPEIDMERIGAFSAISNVILQQKGADLVNAFVSAYGSAIAEFLDLHIACGNITGNSDKIDGIVFDPATSLPTPIALSDLSISSLSSIKNALSPKSSLAQTVWVGNRKVIDAIGLLETTGGAREFPGYVNGGAISPFGIPAIINPMIPSTLNVGGDNRASGTDDVLILADLSKVIVGVSGDTRFATSDHFYFTTDAMAFRAIKMFGQKVISSSSTAGVVAIAQELTN